MKRYNITIEFKDGSTRKYDLYAIDRDDCIAFVRRLNSHRFARVVNCAQIKETCKGDLNPEQKKAFNKPRSRRHAKAT
jgi:hypothetical protein